MDNPVVGSENSLGRGAVATSDMKARLAALKSEGRGADEILDSLWHRHHQAVTGDWHTYEYAGNS